MLIFKCLFIFLFILFPCHLIGPLSYNFDKTKSESLLQGSPDVTISLLLDDLNIPPPPPDSISMKKSNC